MATHNASRGESIPPYSRKRSSTVSSLSMFKPNVPAPPLRVGDSTTLSIWVLDLPTTPVALNFECWPGVAEGDMIEVTTQLQTEHPGFLFIAQPDAGSTRQTQQQITVAKTIADVFGFVNHKEVVLTKIDKNLYAAEYVEITFQDQYLGRPDMWRISISMQHQCIYIGQEISFMGSPAGTVTAIYVQGAKVASAHVKPATKAIFRSLSAKSTIFIQVCRELWDFASDGERYYEKIVHSFLPALFSKWSEAGAKHIVTIVLISRVYYDQTEVEYAAGPLRKDDDGRRYKDFYKVITDLETVQDWRPTLVSLKDSFFAFQRDILLTHHYHRAFQMASANASSDITSFPGTRDIRLVGTLSYAHDGPVLEAINLSLNPSETHYIDRSLSLTGVSTIVITPGTGHFVTSKQLLRSTTLRMLDHGFGLDLVSLAKRPLHSTPVFSFKGEVPELRTQISDKEGRFGSNGNRGMDPLWSGGDSDSTLKNIFWWEPFWISTTFWDHQMDLPFRPDRFVARARMQEIQMLGLLEHDSLSTIQIPYLDLEPFSLNPRTESTFHGHSLRKIAADNFDIATFAFQKNEAKQSSGSTGTIVPSSMTPIQPGKERTSFSLSSSATSSRFPPIAEDHGQEGPAHLTPSTTMKSNMAFMSMPSAPPLPEFIPTQGISASPSHASVLSNKSSSSSKKTQTGSRQTQASLASKLGTGWLFNRFRTSSQPQTSIVSVTASMSSMPDQANISTTIQEMAASNPPFPQPVSIKSQRARTRNIDDMTNFAPNRASYSRTSPLSSSPRDREGADAFVPLRRSTLSSINLPTAASSPPRQPMNPSRPNYIPPYEQVSLARRWRHIFPIPSFQYQIKWQPMLTPACLPLTVEHFPTQQELDTAFEYFEYDFTVDPPSMSSSFCIKVPADWKSQHSQEAKDSFALAVMRGQTATRLAQGFQFIIRSKTEPSLRNLHEYRHSSRHSRVFIPDDEILGKPRGVSEMLKTPFTPVYLSMTNEIHRLSYNGDIIKVELYVRRALTTTNPFKYECLVWPKLGDGYTEVSASFRFPGLDKVSWNSLDMVVAGYEQQFLATSRFWRTRFLVIPTEESPQPISSLTGEKLNEEEIRLAGIDKLADMFGKARWIPASEKPDSYPAPRFIPTYLGPAASILDDNVIAQLDEIHAIGPLKKKKHSDKVFQEYSLSAIVKAMREEDGVPIKDHRWHGSMYHDSFTGANLTSWLVREFSDISTREQAFEAGVTLHEKGLFEHCRKLHGFIDGHYFYRFKGEWAAPRTPRMSSSLWSFRGRHSQSDDKGPDKSSNGPSASPVGSRAMVLPTRKYKKRLVLSQTMVIDADLNRRSKYSETANIHHDIIHNPMTAFHFELNWIATSARCLDELIRQWSRGIEKYGLRLVEGFVDQVTDIRDKNTFQSCFPIRLTIMPPIIKRIPECFFETQLLIKKFGFIVDVEAEDKYSDQVDVFYSYRRSSYKYTQFVHRSGAAFVQVIGGKEGYRFLTNRLLNPGRLGTARNFTEKTPTQVADEIREALHSFCSDPGKLTQFYEEIKSTIPDEDIEPLTL